MKYNRSTKELELGKLRIAKFCGTRVFSLRSWRYYWGYGKPLWHTDDHGVRHLGIFLWWREL